MIRRIALALVLTLGGCGAQAAPADCPEPAPVEQTPAPNSTEPGEDVANEAPAPEELGELEDEDERSAPIRVVAGTCERRMLPPGLHQELDEAASAQLRERMSRWLNDDWGHHAFAPRRGIAFAKSADDAGGDDPPPSWENEQSLHACGIQARWLVASLRQRFVVHGGESGQAPVTCDGTVCCYDDMGEYSSSGGIAFEEVSASGLQLRAAWEVADNGTIGEEYAESLYDRVRSQLARRLRGTCRGEPE